MRFLWKSELRADIRQIFSCRAPRVGLYEMTEARLFIIFLVLLFLNLVLASKGHVIPPFIPFVLNFLFGFCSFFQRLDLQLLEIKNWGGVTLNLSVVGLLHTLVSQLDGNRLRKDLWQTLIFSNGNKVILIRDVVNNALLHRGLLKESRSRMGSLLLLDIFKLELHVTVHTILVELV